MVRLRTRLVGGGRFTCDAWISEFMDALSSDDAAQPAPAAAASGPERDADPEQRAARARENFNNRASR